MKIDRTEAWWLTRADREGNADIGAGIAALDPAEDTPTQHSTRASAPRLVRDGDVGPHRRGEHARVKGRQPGAATPPAGPSPVDDTRIAFGRFVEFMRRQRALTIEQLAERAGLDVGELVSIEDDLRYTPEPRTVYQLARTFNVPQQRLLQLAGLTTSGDARLRQEAVRFAARSESVQKLSREERAALEEFVAALSRQDG